MAHRRIFIAMDKPDKMAGAPAVSYRCFFVLLNRCNNERHFK